MSIRKQESGEEMVEVQGREGVLREDAAILDELHGIKVSAHSVVLCADPHRHEVLLGRFDLLLTTLGRPPELIAHEIHYLHRRGEEEEEEMKERWREEEGARWSAKQREDGRVLCE